MSNKLKNIYMTSVEWFAKRLYEEMSMGGDGRVIDNLLEQALIIHKHEIVQTYKYALQSPFHSDYCWTPQLETTKSEQYYKEKFVSSTNTGEFPFNKVNKIDEVSNLIEQLIDFQIYINTEGLITNHDWDFEKIAKKYIKSLKKAKK